MEGFAAVASAVIALIALGVSIVVAVRQARIATDQTTIQERLAAIEEARRAEEIAARGRARVTASTTGLGTVLVLRNDGSAIAREVQVEITSLDEDPLPTFDGIEVLPVDLQPGQPITFEVMGGMGTADLWRVTVRWTDEGGDHEEPYTLRRGTRPPERAVWRRQGVRVDLARSSTLTTC